MFVQTAQTTGEATAQTGQFPTEPVSEFGVVTSQMEACTDDHISFIRSNHALTNLYYNEDQILSAWENVSALGRHLFESWSADQISQAFCTSTVQDLAFLIIQVMEQHIVDMNREKIWLPLSVIKRGSDGLGLDQSQPGEVKFTTVGSPEKNEHQC